jgi:hypothetical protein
MPRRSSLQVVGRFDVELTRCRRVAVIPTELGEVIG